MGNAGLLVWDTLRMSSARETALRAPWRADEFLDSTRFIDCQLLLDSVIRQ